MEMDFGKCETPHYSCIQYTICESERNALNIRDDLLNYITVFVFHLNSFKVEFQQLTNKCMILWRYRQIRLKLWNIKILP